MKQSTKKVIIPIIAVLLLIAAMGGAYLLLFRQSQPNVVLIVLDTARADHFSHLGYPRNTSPYIDSLGTEGAVFEHAYAPACWTLPSHASLFTGLEPLEAGATSERLFLSESNITIAEILSEAGYDTAAFVCNSWVSKERGFAQGFEEFYEMWRSTYTKQVQAKVSKNEVATTEKIKNWLGDRAQKNEPFFAFVNLNCVHLPYRPPEPYLSDFLSSDYDKADITRISNIMSMWKHLAGEMVLTEHDYAIMRDLYDGEIAFADHCVKQMIERLRSLKLLDDTIVIITSDHGESLGEHGRIDHTLNMYETTLHVPLVIRYPKHFQAGRRVKKLVSLVDITPTLIDLCGAEYQLNTKGEIRSLHREDMVNRPFVVATNERPLTGIAVMEKNFPDFDISTIDYRLGAIRAKDYKFLSNIGGSVELYDMNMDPHETNDISNTKPDIKNKLHHLLNSWRENLVSADDSSIFESQDQESLELLRSLGYIE